MRASDFTRDDCKIGRKRLRYDTLEREWCCQDCGGRLGRVPYQDMMIEDQHRVSAATSWRDGWFIRCGRCHSTRFIHEMRALRQKADAIEVLDGLPPDVAASLE